jgi:hypothetical protein
MNEEGSSMSYAKVNTTICLRGLIFPAGTLVRVWETGRVTSIQPVATNHEVLWYSLPKIHLNHIIPLEKWWCKGIDYGLL